MKVLFYTKHIDKMLYRQIIYKYVSEHYLDLKDWTITIYSTNKKSNIKEFMTDNNNINVKIPHGITGLKSVKIYIQDKSDFGLIVLMNTLVICHELAHAILIEVYKNNPIRKPLRNNDKSGNLKGKILNIWTQEVHDREIENKLRLMTVYYKMNNWKPMLLRVVDITDLV